MYLPTDKKKMLATAQDILDTCTVSQGARASGARALRLWKLTGSSDGNSAIYNKLGRHVDRMGAWVFSPSNLRFAIEFDYYQPPGVLKQGELAARLLTREFRRRDIDFQFSECVNTALTFGSAILKTVPGHGGPLGRMIMPWQFGVYNESETELGRQEAMSETNWITGPELWRRIAHLPDSHKLYREAVSYARTSNQDPVTSSTYFQQVLIAGSQPVVQTSAPFSNSPGGSVSTNGGYDGAMVGAEVSADLIQFHEMWVLDDATEDYVMVQYVPPNILISPLFKRTNPFVPEMIPYSLIRPNTQANYFWGRSEMADLIRLQGLLRDRMEDIRRLMNLQFDRMLAFIGFDGMNDERYDMLRQAGWIASDAPNAKVEDMTPKLPENAFQDVETVIRFMDELSGFVPIMRGEGDPGVRAGSQASTLTRNASPRLRDQALIVERQCADVGDKLFRLRQEKDARAYQLDGDFAGVPENPEQDTSFLLSQLPEDFTVEVDSHSSSPIYMDDNIPLVALGSKLGAIGAEEVVDMLPFANKDVLRSNIKQRAQAEEKFKVENPEAWAAAQKSKR